MSDYEYYFEYNETENTISVCDDDGNETQFELIDLIEYKGGQYVVLLPLDEEDGMREVVILELCGEDGEEQTFEWIDDARVRNAVFGIFKEKFADDFDFTE